MSLVATVWKYFTYSPDRQDLETGLPPLPPPPSQTAGVMTNARVVSLLEYENAAKNASLIERLNAAKDRAWDYFPSCTSLCKWPRWAIVSANFFLVTPLLVYDVIRNFTPSHKIESPNSLCWGVSGFNDNCTDVIPACMNLNITLTLSPPFGFSCCCNGIFDGLSDEERMRNKFSIVRACVAPFILTPALTFLEFWVARSLYGIKGMAQHDAEVVHLETVSRNLSLLGKKKLTFHPFFSVIPLLMQTEISEGTHRQIVENLSISELFLVKKNTLGEQFELFTKNYLTDLQKAALAFRQDIDVLKLTDEGTHRQIVENLSIGELLLVKKNTTGEQFELFTKNYLTDLQKAYLAFTQDVDVKKFTDMKKWMEEDYSFLWEAVDKLEPSKEADPLLLSIGILDKEVDISTQGKKTAVEIKTDPNGETVCTKEINLRALLKYSYFRSKLTDMKEWMEEDNSFWEEAVDILEPSKEADPLLLSIGKEIGILDKEADISALRKKVAVEIKINPNGEIVYTKEINLRTLLKYSYFKALVIHPFKDRDKFQLTVPENTTLDGMRLLLEFIDKKKVALNCSSAVSLLQCADAFEIEDGIVFCYFYLIKNRNQFPTEAFFRLLLTHANCGNAREQVEELLISKYHEVKRKNIRLENNLLSIAHEFKIKRLLDL